jgi:preprotein translocase subunit SecG
MVWRRVLWSFATIAVIVGVVLGLNHTESCKLSSPPQCGSEGPSWAMIGSAFAVATCFFVAGLVLTVVGRKRGTQQDVV